MTSTVRQIAYRIKSEGKAELLRDQREVAEGFRGTYAAAEAGAAAATAATERQERRYRALAQAAREAQAAGESQARYNALLGVGAVSASSARDSAEVFAAQAAAMEDGERRARALRSIIDPLGVAQDRLNDELREYKALAEAGKISTTELARAQQLARQKFDETAASVDRQNRGLSRLVLSSRLNLARQGADVAVTAAMGMNPAMIAIQQGPQILDAMATSGIRVSGAMAAAAASVGVLATATGVLLAAWHSGEANALNLEKATTGLGVASGLTAREVEALAIASADQAKVSVASARDQAAAYVSTGKIGEETIGKLIALGRDYASVMGLDAEGATEALATAMASPDKAARELTRSIGLMDQKTLDHIDTLVKAGQQYEAQAVLVDALSDRMRGHAEQISEIESFWDNAARSLSNYWDQLGRAMYQTREEQVAHLDWRISVNENPAARRSLTRQRDELTASIAMDEQRAFFTGLEARQNRDAQLADDRAPKARTRGNGEAERAARERERRERREEDRQATRDMEIARATLDYDRIIVLEREAELRGRVRELEDDGLSTEKARGVALREITVLEAARQTAREREAVRVGDQAAMERLRSEGAWADLKVLEDRAALDEQIAQYAGQKFSLAEAERMAQTDLLYIEQGREAVRKRMLADAEREHAINLARLSGRDADYDWLTRQRRLDQLVPEVARQNGWNEDSREARDAAMRMVSDEVAAEAEGVRRRWVHDFVDDIRRGGIREALAEQFERATDRLLDRLIDGLLEIDWGAMLKGDGIGGQGGGGGWGTWLSRGLDVLIGRNADGTDYWRGGLTWVGERGPELINAPRGSQIFDHGRSMRMASVSAGAGVMKVEVPVTLALPAGFVPERQLVALLKQAAEVGASEGAKRALGSMQGVQMQMQVHKGG